MEHRKTEENDEEKRFQKKRPKDVGPEDITVHTREDILRVQLCGDQCGVQMDQWRIWSSWQGTRIPLGKFRESCAHGGGEELPHRSRISILSWSTSTGSITKKQTIKPTLEHREEEKLISKGKTHQQHGERNVVSGIEALETMLRNRDQRCRQTRMCDNPKDCGPSESRCCHGSGSCWSVRAHQCVRSDLLQEFDWIEH